AEKINLHLARPGQRSGKKELNAGHVQVYFFLKLASQSDIGLLAFVEKTAGNAPAAVRAKHVLEQQNAAVIVEDQRARGDSETSLAETYHAPAHDPGKVTPDSSKKFGEHFWKHTTRLSFRN